jgi:chloramphenicol 3-O phosphotransferase
VLTDVIVLNGGSSSGKSSIARGLQSVLDAPWLTFGVDTLIDAMPRSMQGVDAGLSFQPDGEITVGPAFRQLEAAWYQALAAMVRAGAKVIVDEVFLGGAASQARLRAALDGLRVLWVGVHCDRVVAAAREGARHDRARPELSSRGDRSPVGMAALQVDLVHDGVVYDLEVDTTHTAAVDCARVIAARILASDPMT